MKQGVYHELEHSRRIIYAKVHHEWFKQSSICPEGSLPFIPLSYSNVVITLLYVKLGKELGSLDLVNQLLN